MNLLSKVVIPLTLVTSINTYALFGQDESKNLLEYEKNTINVYQQNVNSVVNITNIRKVKRGFIFDYMSTEVPAGAGSGFVWDKDGHIVTNYHVVEDGDKFTVTFHNDKKQYKAKLVGVEPLKDLAVLKLEERPGSLAPIITGNSKDLVIGQKAMALGNPFGLDHTITAGIISATGRSIKGIGGVSIANMIQTDTSINPGNSGGPLLDSTGRVIGVNTMIYSQSGSSAGVGFAVPIDTVKRIVPELIKHGKIVRPGFRIGVLPEPYRDRFGIKKGIVITYVDEDGPAGKAGMKGMTRDEYGRPYVGDILVKVDGKEVNNFDEIYNVLENYKVGDEVEIEYIRDDKVKKTKMKLATTGDID
ncbi:trypsin [Bacteriovorax sp. BSW11_IV]|uniref:S1C family serine protease n=1 Tax=Bacteriovorax sp. BSW11_IV TaxID=1353529 RepID=UPI000389E87B|nr:trypsin-like peptidase domain-containing protein [Bacteriovorax sp. BSW11_IV]EQC48376.1 trypsin [Bacteriovorax sp. BSW11_IV]